MRLIALFTLLLAASAAAQPANPIHPPFAPRDAAGKLAARAEDVAAETTCGSCHDVGFIAAHNDHARATCIDCHVAGGRLDVTHLEDGKLRRQNLFIGRPTPGGCAACHGLVSDGTTQVLAPSDFEAVVAPSMRTFSLTMGEGAVVAPQHRSDSFLNLAGKEQADQPWDIHAARLVDCVACHYARNDPRRTDLKHAALPSVLNDPRRLSTAEFLLRPDHRLAAAECRSCHAPLTTHVFLPYRERHMQVLACQTCHAPGPQGPALQMVDATVATAAGTPAYVYRNVEAREGDSLNTALLLPLRPLLVQRTGPDGVRRLAPVNVVSRWRWIDAVDRSTVPFVRVVAAFREGDRWASAVLAALDADRDGALSSAELRLDSPTKVAAIAARLSALGVARPEIEGELDVHPIAHGIVGPAQALRECGACHSKRSRLDGDYALAAYLPGGKPPRMPADDRVALAPSLAPGPNGALALRADAALPGGLHILGRSRNAATNLIGFLLFLAVSTGVTLHGGVRFLLRLRAPRPHLSKALLTRVYSFGCYERLWHWTMALSGMGLITTGLALHTGAWRWPISLATAVKVHNAMAVVLMLNAFLSLFYHLATAAIRTFLPQPQGLFMRMLEHLEYQTRGIFRGGPHPSEPAGQKLNPLQQLTYLALLNLLFPLQITTGVLLWVVGSWPTVGAELGGLTILAPLHNLGAWLFLTFFVLHVYLVTTGRTIGEHLRAMTTGYQLVEAGPPTVKGP